MIYFISVSDNGNDKQTFLKANSLSELRNKVIKWIPYIMYPDDNRFIGTVYYTLVKENLTELIDYEYLMDIDDNFTPIYSDDSEEKDEF